MEKKAKVPKLRFPGFTGEWKARKLGTMTEIGDIDHRMPSTVENGIPYLMTGDFCGINELNFDNAKRISKDDYVLLSKKIKPQKSDIIFARYASVGAVRYIDFTKDFLISYSCAIIKSSNQIFSKYLYHFLTSPVAQKQIKLEINTGSQANIGIDSMKNNIVVSMPLYNEQALIAHFLSNLDTLITLHQRKMIHLQEKKKSLLQKMFPKKGERFPELRFPGFTDAWEQRKLDEFGKATGGTSIESEFVVDGKYKVISIGSYSESSKYTDQGIRTNATSKTEQRILDKNDLTMILNDKTASGNIIGRVLLIDADDTYVYNQRTERIEVNKNLFESNFLFQLLNADNVRSKIIKASQGNTQIYVNWTAIKELSYLVPISKDEQKQIATYFENIDNLITLHQRKLTHLKTQKKALLQQMFV
ncbi:restriction endonuclease subunit S [Pectinatus frisingensis]|uniref:restriction endonuclease subunit S n=1 Tax=Pectinatus frisingensis TaxID=865 RepID=UPI0018C52B76|nr:restriction endonuclease subunit S [Pectinatus frisingensis]